MNNELIVDSNVAMTSIDVASLTGKQHAHVMRDIRNLLDKGVNPSNFGLVKYKDAKGEERPIYQLTPKGCLILALGYDPVLREKIIDRLEEWETGKRQNVPSYQVEDPIKRAEMWIEEQKQRIALKQKIEKDAPKVEYADKINISESCCKIGSLAKFIQLACDKAGIKIKIGERKLYEWLRSHEYVAKSGTGRNLPNQRYIDQGLFVIKKNVFMRGDTPATDFTTYVTEKGQKYFIDCIRKI